MGHPQMNCRKFFTANTRVKHSFSVIEKFRFFGVISMLVNARGRSIPAFFCYSTAPTPYPQASGGDLALGVWVCVAAFDRSSLSLPISFLQFQFEVRLLEGPEDE